MTEAAARSHCKARDHGRCKIPGCAEHAPHLHHIVFRSQDRKLKWETRNLLSLCAGHHALVHAGLLTITGDADGDFEVEGDDFDLVAQSCSKGFGMATESVYCACGSQWHDHWVTNAASIIADHKARWMHHQGGCGELTHAAFAAKFRCNCDLCAVERSVRRRLKHGVRVRA